MGTRMLQRRGTSAEWTAANTILGDGEFGWNRTTGEIKVGDGATAWNVLPVSFVTKAVQDAAYVNRTLIDAAGDLLVGSADNTVVRLGKGADGQRLTMVAGAVVWADLPIAANPFSVVDAAGDLIVGSGNDAVTRLAKGANGTSLTVDGAGNLVWAVPSAIDSSKVAKAGDAMTGELKMRNNVGIRLSPGAGDVATDPKLTSAASIMYARKADGSYCPFDAGALYDNGSRVYSAANPPPPGMTVLGGASGQATNASANTSTASITFTAPSNGRVVIRASAQTSALSDSQLQFSLDNTNFYTAAQATHYGAGVSPGPVVPSAYGIVTFTGLTPGGSYTVYHRNTQAGALGFAYSVEG